MTTFTGYFDASGNAEQSDSFVIVSGYIANHFQWKLFEAAWKEIHSHYGVKTPFHMSDFMAATASPERYARQKSARPDYVSISRQTEKAKDFFKQLCIAQLSMVACGISCILIPPYALAARTCVAQVHEWERQFNIQNPVECIFEKGDLEQEKFTELVTEEGGDPPIYRNKKDHAGLQGADQYAWEQFHYMKKSRTGEHLPARGSFKFLLNLIPCIHAQVTQESIIHVCEEKGIDPRTGIKK